MPRVKSLTRALGVLFAQPDEREENGGRFEYDCILWRVKSHPYVMFLPVIYKKDMLLD